MCGSEPVNSSPFVRGRPASDYSAQAAPQSLHSACRSPHPNSLRSRSSAKLVLSFAFQQLYGQRRSPPVRGWITQQIVKLAAAAASQDDVVLVGVDSDVEFIRPFGPNTFMQNGTVRFYRKIHAVNDRLPRHVSWHRGARALLGLRPAAPPFNDYISAMIACDPGVVRRMLVQIETTTKCSWVSAVASPTSFPNGRSTVRSSTRWWVRRSTPWRRLIRYAMRGGA